MAVFKNRLGCFAVLCLFFLRMLLAGLLKGLGFMLPTFKEQFTAQTWLIGWMLAIIAGVIKLAGIFAAPLGSMFSTRGIVMASGVMVGGSLFVASFGSSLGQITVILALGLGIGISLTNILTRVMIARCFTNNYATASGIAQSGSPLGLILGAPLVQLFLDTYGWRSVFLLLGGISLHLVACGALLRQPSTKRQSPNLYQPVSSCEESINQDNTKSRKNFLKDTFMTITSRFGISVCLQLSFWITATVFVFNMWVNTFWYIFFVDHIAVKGFTANDAVVFSAAAGVGKLISKIIVGILVDKDVLKLRPALAILTTGCMICLLTDPWMDSYWLVLINVVIYVGFNGAITSLSDVYTRELIGTDLLASAFSWIEILNGIVILFSGFFPGLVHDMTGNYDVVFIIMGCLYVPPLVALFAENIRSK